MQGILSNLHEQCKKKKISVILFIQQYFVLFVIFSKKTKKDSLLSESGAIFSITTVFVYRDVYPTRLRNGIR